MKVGEFKHMLILDPNVWRDLDDNAYRQAFSNSDCSVGLNFSFRADKNFAYKLNLPVYPEDVSKSISANYSDANIIGRPVSISMYTGTSDPSVSFTLKMHRENYVKNADVVDRNNIDAIVSLIEAANYPSFVQNGTFPPIVTYKFGDTEIVGKQTGYQCKWSGPKIEGKYMYVELNITVDVLTNDILNADRITTTNPRAYDRSYLDKF